MFQKVLIARACVRRASATLSISLSLATAFACSSPNAPTSAAAYTLTGTVSEATAAGVQGVAGATIEETGTHRSTITDANGFFRLSGLAALTDSISVGKPGYTTTTRTVTVRENASLDIQLVRAITYTVAGVVSERTDGGVSLLPGVSIALGEGFPDLITTTDADGRFALKYVEPRAWGLIASKDGYAPVLLSLTVVADTTLDISLGRSGGSR